MTAASRTSDEYGLVITDLIAKQGVDVGAIGGTIMATVVPNTTHSLTNAIKRYIKCEPVLVNSATDTGIQIDIPNPK